MTRKEKISIGNTITGDESLESCKIKFDLLGVKYDSDVDMLLKIYRSNRRNTFWSVLKNIDISKLVDEKYARDVLYRAWTGGKTSPFERCLTARWLKFNPSFRE